jgi:hypothetical protein
MKYIVLNIDTIIYRPKILATEAEGEQIVVSSEDVAELKGKIKKGNILVADRLSLIEIHQLLHFVTQRTVYTFMPCHILHLPFVVLAQPMQDDTCSDMHVIFD